MEGDGGGQRGTERDGEAEEEKGEERRGRERKEDGWRRREGGKAGRGQKGRGGRERGEKGGRGEEGGAPSRAQNVMQPPRRWDPTWLPPSVGLRQSLEDVVISVISGGSVIGSSESRELSGD